MGKVYKFEGIDDVTEKQQCAREICCKRMLQNTNPEPPPVTTPSPPPATTPAPCRLSPTTAPAPSVDVPCRINAALRFQFDSSEVKKEGTKFLQILLCMLSEFEVKLH